MNKIQRLEGKLQEIQSRWQRFPLIFGILKRLFCIILFGGIFCLLVVIPYTLAPKDTVIYYANVADAICFTLRVDEQQIFDVRSDTTMRGIAVFEGVSETEENIIFENTITGEKYSFPVPTKVESDASLLHIRLESTERSAFTCKVEVEPENKAKDDLCGNQDGAVNRIHVFDFSENVLITFSNGDNSAFAVSSDGGFIPDGEYQVSGCNSLYFYMNNPTEDAIISKNRLHNGLTEHMFGLAETIEYFDILNSNKTTLEATVNGNTDFHALGRIRISGQSSNQDKGDPLWIEISDFGIYPIEVELSGVANELKIGNSYYNFKTVYQWMYENWNAVLLSVLGTFFAAIVTKLFAKKSAD